MLPINNSQINIELSRAAFEQIALIKTHDYTLENMDFRLKIGGKGCDGFTYETGFSEKLDDDIVLKFQFEDRYLDLLVDPFAAHYCSEGELDFIFNPTGEEGFEFRNKNEHKYHGKFFSDESMLPPGENF